MAKNSFPMMKSGGGIMSKLISIGVVIALVTLIVKYPSDAASWLTNGLHGAGSVIEGFVNFARAVFGS
jgi:hypothetical protein